MLRARRPSHLSPRPCHHYEALSGTEGSRVKLSGINIAPAFIIKVRMSGLTLPREQCYLRAFCFVVEDSGWALSENLHGCSRWVLRIESAERFDFAQVPLL